MGNLGLVILPIPVFAVFVSLWLRQHASARNDAEERAARLVRLRVFAVCCAAVGTLGCVIIALSLFDSSQTVSSDPSQTASIDMGHPSFWASLVLPMGLLTVGPLVVALWPRQR